MDIRLRGFVVTRSPVNVMQHGRNDHQNGFITVLHLHQGGQKLVGSICGNTLKGLLRHRASRLVMDAFAAADGRPYEPTLSTNELFWLKLGGISDSVALKRTPDVLAVHALKEQHPVFGLFGGVEPFFMEGQLKVGVATGDLVNGPFEADEQNYTRRDPILADPGLAAAMPREDVGRYLAQLPDVRRRGNASARITKIDGELLRLRNRSGGEIDAKRKELEAERTALKGVVDEVNEAGVKHSVSHLVKTIRAIPAGVRLAHRVVGFNLPPEHIGLLLETFCSFEDHCNIGGKSGIGYGAVRFEYDIGVREGRGRPWRSGGRLVVEDDVVEMDREHSDLKPLLQAWATLQADPSRLPRSSAAFLSLLRGGDESEDEVLDA